MHVVLDLVLLLWWIINCTQVFNFQESKTGHSGKQSFCIRCPHFFSSCMYFLLLTLFTEKHRYILRGFVAVMFVIIAVVLLVFFLQVNCNDVMN